MKAEKEQSMGKIEWEEFKGQFPKAGIYLIRFTRRNEDDYTTVQVYDPECKERHSVSLDNGSARGHCCLYLSEMTITGYVYLMELED